MWVCTFVCVEISLHSLSHWSFISSRMCGEMWIYLHRGNHLRCCSTQTWRRTDTYTPAYVKWIARGKLLCSTGNSAWCLVMTQRGGMRGGREALKGGALHILIADSCCCMAETNTILQSTFIFQWKNFPRGKKKVVVFFSYQLYALVSEL